MNYAMYMLIGLAGAGIWVVSLCGRLALVKRSDTDSEGAGRRV